MNVLRYQDARAFYERTLPYLLQREAENNLMIGIALRLADGTGRWGDDPPFLFVVEERGHVEAAALQTPPHNLLLTQMHQTEASLLADHLRSSGHALPGIMGPTPAAQAFTVCWADEKSVRSQRGKTLRIYQSEQVIPPPPPGGHAEEATLADAEQLLGWIEEFVATTDPAAGRPEEIVRQALEKRQFWLWKNPDPVSLAAFCGPTPNGIRINLVYTPSEHRGRGYATANVAALSQHLLDAGRTFCCLFADLANPTSNSIYQRIGYQKVCDLAEYRFASPDE